MCETVSPLAQDRGVNNDIREVPQEAERDPVT